MSEAPRRSAKERSAPLRFALCSKAPWRLTPVKSAPQRLAPRRLALFPNSPFDSTQFRCCSRTRTPGTPGNSSLAIPGDRDSRGAEVFVSSIPAAILSIAPTGDVASIESLRRMDCLWLQIVNRSARPVIGSRLRSYRRLAAIRSALRLIFLVGWAGPGKIISRATSGSRLPLSPGNGQVILYASWASRELRRKCALLKPVASPHQLLYDVPL